MLLLGVLLIMGAIVAGFVAFGGAPVGRVPADRVAALSLKPRETALSRVTDSLVVGVESVLRRRGWRPFSARELELAGVSTPVPRLVVLILSVTVAMFALGLVLANALVGILLGALVPFAAKAWLSIRGTRLCNRFAAQLPQTLQMMAASLRAGHSLPRVLDAVSRETDAPTSTELARVVNENRLGRDLVESLETVAERMRSQDFVWVAGAIAAQRETGGNLNEILDQVAETIRERHHIRMQVKSLSAEGRLSAVILMALPVLIGLYYTVVSAETMTVFVGTAIGKLLLLGSAVMYVLGGLWMRSVVKIDF
ncbi:type II secretion system F family protein [Aeromicrobium chenweiae]|uniref:Type II secretion system protein F n=1 Tax=Aeromicrobium chenweiae TaxID=2079793 RepID=A0A2S0WJB9_9ACTN|nr:type II secretion system F family protein [Aeromicrobium chenweiae]AWB91382.1 type II secretion system protein F [Aeromicrobium chenweiae]TGN30687.1 type II secretion system protein F [Aeromicrobium chenweiae]